jgi:hypothetical protein
MFARLGFAPVPEVPVLYDDNLPRGGAAQNDEHDDINHPRAEELESELAAMRKAFEEYVNTTKNLEIGLDMELKDMRKYTTNTKQ